MNLYAICLLEIYIGFRILKTVFESSFAHGIFQKQSALIPFLEFLLFYAVNDLNEWGNEMSHNNKTKSIKHQQFQFTEPCDPSKPDSPSPPKTPPSPFSAFNPDSRRPPSPPPTALNHKEADKKSSSHHHSSSSSKSKERKVSNIMPTLYCCFYHVLKNVRLISICIINRD